MRRPEILLCKSDRELIARLLRDSFDMDNPIVIASLLNFAVVAAGAIEMKRVGESGFDVSPVSYQLRVPLVWLAIIAFPLAVYCLIKTQGVVTGIAMWCGLIAVLAVVAVAIRA